MAKNFNKAGSTKAFAEVEKKDALKARVITVQMISDEDIFDYPNNDLDITDTADLEKSIDEHGFIDPLEVTSYGMPEGKYMIVSGHRRRNAGRKKGIKTFPCLIKSFDNADTVDSYVLFANAKRDTAKDPLLYFRYAKLTQRHLEAIGFTGSMRQEVAERLGITAKHVDRYLKLDRIIDPIINLIQTENLGVSSVEPLFTLNENEQSVVYDMMKECLDYGNDLTRKTVAHIVSEYKKGLTSWQEFDKAINSANSDDITLENEQHELKDSGLPLHTYTDANTKPGQSGKGNGGNRNNEIRREFDPIAANADDADRAKKEWEESRSEDDNEGDECNYSDNDDNSTQSEQKKKSRSRKFINALANMENCMFDGFDWDFSDDDVASDAIVRISNFIVDIYDEMKIISTKFDVSDALEEAINNVKNVYK